MKFFVLIVLAVLLLSYGAGSIVCAALLGNDTDMMSLIDFKRAITDDPKGAFSSWNTNIHFCNWQGVKCSLTQRDRVEVLDLSEQSLVGQISPSLGNMSYLASLNLSRSKFSGQIPNLGRLQELMFLDLSYNSLQGSIPVTLTNCSSLRVLDLSRNLLVGEIPAEIALLSNLTRLWLPYNDLTRVIPPGLGNITSLEHIILMYNQLEGTIPDEFGKLSNMSNLLLGENKLSGRIPESVFNLSLLNQIALELNMLVGSLPSSIGDGLPNLQRLFLGGNMLEGLIPDSLGNASELQHISLSYNHGFRGQIPPSLGKLWKLNTLGLDGNSLETNDSRGWEFLDALSNCTLLEMLSLYGNLLQGVLPNSVGNLSSNLDNLVFGKNMLYGLVPSSIGNLHRLTKLGLEENNFSGPIDGWIANLASLQGLYLQHNYFTGKIPTSIGNNSQLSELFLGNNQFHGPIPSSIENLQQLLYLDLSYNNLQNHIPQEVFRVATIAQCSLSHNSLEGQIPYINNLQQLNYLDLSSNKLTGEIPATLRTCQQLQTIKMGWNFLSGSIPISLGSLNSLIVLNLSHNNLSGSIPIGLSKLQLLTQLDLSDNQLEGEVPINGVFKNSSAISLKGNWRLCGGVLDLHMPSCPTVSQRRSRWENYLLKVLVPIFGIMSLILLVYLTFFRKRMLRNQSSLPSSGERFPKVSYKDLAQATENFAESNLIGRGSCGSVYRGKLTKEHMVVAVKVFDLDMQGAAKSFVSECKALRNIRHRNLLPILTACSTVDNRGNDFKALVYEFMPNGNLDTWLHWEGDRNARNRLDLSQRMKIAVDIADALQYIHHDCESPIIHCDLKPSNILLDYDMTAHLGDFGIARFYMKSKSAAAGDSSTVGTVTVKGTIGYIAPEYAGGTFLSTSGDVYSFGIVLLEILTGKRPTDPMFCDELSIVSFVRRNFPDQMLHVLDASLVEEYQDCSRANLEEENEVHQCLLSLLKVALSCASQSPNERMNMREAATELHAINMSYIS
uniref:Uncharacterized protein n=1 Tax=Avena sativa TaxID=4498 RepID=A0ACD5UCE9_AVESA